MVFATRRSSSSRISVSTTTTLLPTFSGVAVAVTVPPRTAASRLVFDSIVVVRSSAERRLR
jgi:hypothetical protein